MQKITGQSSASQVSTEAIDEIARHLEASEALSFRSACKGADIQEFHNVTQRFFSTWRTSLIGQHLSTLEAISRNVELRSYVKNIHVEDDCDRNDPWNTTEPLRSENVWPRDDTGIVLSDHIGVTSFRAMLKDKRLCPETIRIRDYRIDNANFKLCPKTTRIRDYRIGIGTPTVPDSEPAAALARDIIDSIDVAIVSLGMQTLQLELSENSILKSPSLAPGGSLRGPQISEVIISLSPEHQGQGAGFSLLHSVRLLVIPYWLEQVLYRALNLESLEISVAKSWDTMLAAGTHYPKLKKLAIQGSKLHSRTVLATLANSKYSLTSISFSMVTLVQGSTWTELLSSIGGDFPNLTYFRIKFVRQGDAPSSAVTFLGFGNDGVMEQYRPGLDLDERGPLNDRRLTKIIYHGPNAGLVLKSLAVHAALYERTSITA